MPNAQNDVDPDDIDPEDEVDEDEVDDEDDDQDDGVKDALAEFTKDGKFDAERAVRTILNQRQSERAAKTAARDLKQRVAALEKKGKPKDQQDSEALSEATSRAEKAEARADSMLVRTVALEAATALGFRSPSLAHRLLDPSEIEWDDDEDNPQPTNVKSILREMLKENPELRGRRRRTSATGDGDDDDDDGADAGVGRSRKAGGAMDFNKAIRQAIGK